MKLQLIKYACVTSLALSASYAYAATPDVVWINTTHSTLYLQVYHNDECMLSQPKALGYNAYYPDKNDDDSDKIWGHMSGTQSEVECSNSNLDPSKAVSNVSITSYTRQDNSANIDQEGNGFTTTKILVHTTDTLHQFTVTAYNPPPPGPPAKITTVDFKWDGIEANNPQGLSSTVDLLTSMLGKRYPSYELIDTKITKGSNNAYDIDIKYHDTDKDQ